MNLVSLSNNVSLVDAVLLNPEDNVCVAARPFAAGTTIQVAGQELKLRSPIKIGHKIAIRPIRRGERVRKYGQTIGFTTEDVQPGDHVHSHNVEIGHIKLDYASATETPPPPTPLERSFLGYQRGDGRVGTRNYIGVISTVNCSATVCKYIAQRFTPDVLRNYPNVDGVVAFKHEGGCAMEFGGMKHEMLNRTMAGIARHPNIGGYLLIGLGCEQGAMGYLLDSQRLTSLDAEGQRRMPVVFSMQDIGGTAKTIEAGVRAIHELLPRVNDVRRVPCSASHLILGTNCGGSDGNSGVTANPALGVASDLLVACGGTSVLAETPEIFGAEHLLTRRAVSVAVADKLLERIRWWHWYVGLFGGVLDNNPSVGNKEGGLTTIAEKSLGAVAKAGSTAMVDVVEYSEPITAKGMVVMDTPGFDPASVTGLIAGGSNLVVFTTGRGSCFGCKPVPSIKIATNTPMYERMVDDMDINAGTILTEGKSVAEVGREIFEEMLAVASGKKTKSELHGVGDEEFVPWTVGPTL